MRCSRKVSKNKGLALSVWVVPNHCRRQGYQLVNLHRNCRAGRAADKQIGENGSMHETF